MTLAEGDGEVAFGQRHFVSTSLSTTADFVASGREKSLLLLRWAKIISVDVLLSKRGTRCSSSKCG